MIKLYLKLAGYFVLAFVISIICFLAIPINSLIVNDQNKGQSLNIAQVTLNSGGFIVVTSLNPETDFPDEIDLLNQPIYLPPGRYRDINIMLNDNALNSVNRVAITLYLDSNKNGYFARDPDNSTDFDDYARKINGTVIRRIINVY